MIKANNQDKQQYTCPMHPEVQSEQPGTCPKCGMELVKQERQPQAQTASNKNPDQKEF